MSSPFNVSVKVDPAQALGAAKSVGDALGKTEAAGVDAGKAIGDAFDKASVKGQKAAAAARAAAAAFKSVADGIRSQALGAASSALAGLTRQLEHEASILRQLRGPMDDYKRDLEAINMLHKRGQINAREYAQAIAATRQGLGGGSVTSSIDNRTGKTAGAGGMGDKLSGIAAAAAPYMAGAYAGKQVLDFADAHTVLANKLTASTGALSRANKQSMLSTELYDRLHDIAQGTRQAIDATTTSYLGLSSATSKLGISQEQTLRMTETINKLTANAGPEASAAGLRQLGQALSSGRLQGDEFKSLSENLPDLRDAIANALGVGIDKLREMSSEGKLTSKVLVEAFGKMGDSADLAFASTKATFSDRLTQAKNFATKYADDFIGGATGGGPLEKIVRQEVEEYQQRTAAANAAAESARKVGLEVQHMIDVFSGFNAVQVTSAVFNFNAALTDLKKSLINVEAQVRTQEYRGTLELAKNRINVVDELQQRSIPGFSDARLSSMGMIPQAAITQEKIAADYDKKRLQTPGATEALNYEEKVKSLKASIGDLRSEYANGTIGVESFTVANRNLQAQLTSLTGAVDGVAVALDYDARVKALRTGLANLKTEYKDSGASADGFRHANKQLNDQLMSLTGGVNYWKKIWDDIKQPQVDFRGGVAALNSIMATGKITMAQYNEEFRKLSESYDKSGFAKLWNDVAMNPGGFRPSQVTGDDGKLRDPNMDEYNAQRRDYDLSRHDRAANAALGELERNAVGDPIDTSPDLESDYAEFPKNEAAAKEYQTFLLELQSTTAQWEAQQIQANDHVGNAWDAMAAKATDVAGAMESVFTSAYQGIEDALTSLITKQKLDMQSFVDMMLEQMARLAIRSAISGIAGAIGGGGGDPATGLGDLGGLIFDPSWSGGSSARTAQPTSPTIGPAATGNGVSARTAGAPVTVVVNQDRDALLPALDRNNGRRTVANIALREAGPALSRRPRYS